MFRMDNLLAKLATLQENYPELAQEIPDNVEELEYKELRTLYRNLTRHVNEGKALGELKQLKQQLQHCNFTSLFGEEDIKTIIGEFGAIAPLVAMILSIDNQTLQYIKRAFTFVLTKIYNMGYRKLNEVDLDKVNHDIIDAIICSIGFFLYKISTKLLRSAANSSIVEEFLNSVE